MKWPLRASVERLPCHTLGHRGSEIVEEDSPANLLLGPSSRQTGSTGHSRVQLLAWVESAFQTPVAFQEQEAPQDKIFTLEA